MPRASPWPSLPVSPTTRSSSTETPAWGKLTSSRRSSTRSPSNTLTSRSDTSRARHFSTSSSLICRRNVWISSSPVPDVRCSRRRRHPVPGRERTNPGGVFPHLQQHLPERRPGHPGLGSASAGDRAPRGTTAVALRVGSDHRHPAARPRDPHRDPPDEAPQGPASEVPPEMLVAIARRVQTNIRELEGA